MAFPRPSQRPDGSCPQIPNAWAQAEWTFWQCDGNGGRRFPGGIDADFDVFNGSEDDLRQFLVACVTPPGSARSPSPPAATKDVLGRSSADESVAPSLAQARGTLLSSEAMT